MAPAHIGRSHFALKKHRLSAHPGFSRCCLRKDKIHCAQDAKDNVDGNGDYSYFKRENDRPTKIKITNLLDIFMSDPFLMKG